MKSCWIYCGAPSEHFEIKPPADAFIIAADSGYTFLKKLGITPNILIGDLDSLTDSIPDNLEIITAPSEKDDTDSMLAIKIAMLRGYRDITLAASIGGRLDHTYANIQSLAYIAENGGKGQLLGENDIVLLCTVGKYTFSKPYNMYFSIFSYSESSIISLSGTKYPLNNYCLTNKFPLGVSNEIIEADSQLTVDNGQVLIIFSKM